MPSTSCCPQFLTPHYSLQTRLPTLSAAQAACCLCYPLPPVLNSTYTPFLTTCYVLHIRTAEHLNLAPATSPLSLERKLLAPMLLTTLATRNSLPALFEQLLLRSSRYLWPTISSAHAIYRQRLLYHVVCRRASAIHLPVPLDAGHARRRCEIPTLIPAHDLRCLAAHDTQIHVTRRPCYSSPRLLATEIT